MEIKLNKTSIKKICSDLIYKEENTNDRTFLVGGIESQPTFLYIFKPQSNVVILEIWKWASAPHYGHVVLNGDELVYKKSFSCMRLSL